MSTYQTARRGLAIIGTDGQRLGGSDYTQTVDGDLAARRVLADLIGGEGVYSGGAQTEADLSGGGTEYPASALALLDDAGEAWYFLTTAATAITFNVTSAPGGTGRLYAVPVGLDGASPAAADGRRAQVEFVGDKASNPAPAHSLLLGTGTIAASAFTAYTAGAGTSPGEALVRPRLANLFDVDPAALADDTVPAWDETAGEFVLAPRGGSGGSGGPTGSHGLDDHTDVTLTATGGPATPGYSVGVPYSDPVANYITVPDADSLKPTAAMSVACWVMLDADNLVGIAKGDTIADGWYLRLGHATYGIEAAAYAAGSVNGTGPLAVDTWHHVVWSFDSVAAVQKLYLNGVEVASDVAAGPITPATDALQIGARGPIFYGGGRLDVPMLFGVALTAEDAAYWYNGGQGRIPTGAEPGLRLALPLDEGTGTAAADVSPYGNDGTLTGSCTWEDGVVPVDPGGGADGEFLRWGTGAWRNQTLGAQPVDSFVVADADPRVTLRDSDDADAETYVERSAGTTSHVADVLAGGDPATAKPAVPELDAAYTVPGEGQPLATDLLLDYVMTEGSGTTLDDLSTGDHDGTLEGSPNTPTWDTDANLLCSPLLTFDGVNDRVDCGAVGNFEYNDPFSVFFRFRTSNGGPGVEQVVLGKANSGSGVGDDRARGWIAITYEGRIGLALSNNEYDSPPTYVYRSLGVWTTGTGFCDGNWHDVLLTYDGTYVEAAIEIYVDGVLEAHTSWTDNLGANTIANAENMHLGIRDADAAFPFDGDLAHVTLWDRVLSADEAAELTADPYRMEGAGGDVTNAVAYLTVEPPTEEDDVADVTVGQAVTLVSVPGKLVVVNGQLRCAADTKYGPPVAGTYAVGDLWLDRAGSLWQCSVAGAPGTWVQLEPGRQTTAQWADFATGGNWNGGAALADYRCFEPEVAMEWAYDATYGWLGRHWEAISEHTSDVTSSSQYRLGILPRVHDLLLTHAMAYTGTTATCDGSNYWTVRLVKGYLSGGSFSYTACTDDVVRNTVSNAEVTWTPDGVVIDTDVYGWYARQYAKTGSPGTLTFGHVGVTFRYVRK
jgi:hypothetical protein